MKRKKMVERMKGMRKENISTEQNLERVEYISKSGKNGKKNKKNRNNWKENPEIKIREKKIREQKQLQETRTGKSITVGINITKRDRRNKKKN